MARVRPTPQRTYGYRRSSILASLLNAIILYIAIGAIALEAFRRLLMSTTSVEPGVIIWVALAGVVINGVTTALFISGRKGDLNIRGIVLHMAADAGISAGVVVGGLLIALTGLSWIDPALSLVIAAVIAVATWSLLRDSFNLALDAVPSDIDSAAVETYLAGLPDVYDVHHVHIWAMSTTETALTAHLVRTADASASSLIERVQDGLKNRFGIGHATLQIEDAPCEAKPPSSVGC
jgi:cobalt-zinc-cadmium efflux system protein